MVVSSLESSPVDEDEDEDEDPSLVSMVVDAVVSSPVGSMVVVTRVVTSPGPLVLVLVSSPVLSSESPEGPDGQAVNSNKKIDSGLFMPFP